MSVPAHRAGAGEAAWSGGGWNPSCNDPGPKGGAAIPEPIAPTLPGGPVDPDRARLRIRDEPFLDIGGRTDVGRLQDSNTDFFLTADLYRSLVLGPSSLQIAEGDVWAAARQGKLLIVADGITDSGMGEIASWITVDVIAHYMTGILPWTPEPSAEDDQRLLREVQRALMACQTRVHQQAHRTGQDDQPVGSTMTMAYVVWPHLQVFHVGNGRAYLYRDQHLLQLTTDDTLAQRMLDRELITAERAESTPFRHVLTNVIGGDDQVIRVEHHRFELEVGDQILLCTDGLTRHLGAADIKAELERGATAATCCRRLVERANQLGGEDNITTVLARTG